MKIKAIITKEYQVELESGVVVNYTNKNEALNMLAKYELTKVLKKIMDFSQIEILLEDIEKNPLALDAILGALTSYKKQTKAPVAKPKKIKKKVWKILVGTQKVPTKKFLNFRVTQKSKKDYN